MFKLLLLAALALGGVATPPQPDQLSEMEKLKAENLALKYQALNAQMQEIQKQVSQLSMEIGKAHPGYAMDWTKVELQKLPDPPAQAPTKPVGPEPIKK